DSRHPALSGSVRLDAALHEQRRRRQLPARVLRTDVRPTRGVVTLGVTVTLTALEVRALLLDIEGTTTPVEFVSQVLFPYARVHAAEYLARHEDSTDCQEAVALLRKEYEAASLAHVLEYVFSLMDRDKKSPGLKALQGLIWQDGYRSGELRG